MSKSLRKRNPVEYEEPSRYWGSVGAGILAVALSTGRVLMQLRSPYVDQPSTWGVIGGRLDTTENGEELREVACREFLEETGYDGPMDLTEAFRFTSANGNFMYQNYIGRVDREFEPLGDWETSRFEWMTFNEVFEIAPKHFGLTLLLIDPVSIRLLRAATSNPKTQNPLSSIVYHKTTGYALNQILRDNAFLTTVAAGRDIESKHGCNKYYFFSFMRSLRSDYGGGGVTLVLDGVKLNQNYKGGAVNYWAGCLLINVDEMEDRIFTNKPYIPNASKYITAIHLHVSDRDKTQVAFSRQLHETVNMASVRHIPLYLYDNFDEYKMLRADKALDINRLEPSTSGPKPYSPLTKRRTSLDTLVEYLDHVLHGTSLLTRDTAEGVWNDFDYDYYSLKRQFARNYLPIRGESDAARNIRDELQHGKNSKEARRNIHKLIQLIRSTQKRGKSLDIQRFVEYVHDKQAGIPNV